jgi:hypothetical protein
MPVKLPSLRVFFTEPEKLTKSEKFTKVKQQWTGWSRSENVELPLPRQLLLVSGKKKELTLSILRDTWTLPLR